MLWPVRGLIHFAKQPGLWARPLIAVAAAWLIVIAAVVAVGVGSFPSWNMPWSDWLVQASLALAKSFVAFLALWLTLVPLALSLALENLALRVQRERGAKALAQESLPGAVVSATRVVLGTMGPRLGWLALSCVALFLPPPLSLIIGAIGMAHVGVIDAVDTALSALGVPGGKRLEILRCHRHALRSGATIAAVLNIALGFTVIGWLFWFPALVCGAAMIVPQWPDISLGEKPK